MADAIRRPRPCPPAPNAAPAQPAGRHRDLRQGELGNRQGSGDRDILFVISPQKGYVNLGFYDGAALPDPDELLEGAGKSHRHLKLRTQSQLKDARVICLIQAAVPSGIPDGMRSAMRSAMRRPALEGRARSTAACPAKEET